MDGRIVTFSVRINGSISSTLIPLAPTVNSKHPPKVNTFMGETGEDWITSGGASLRQSREHSTAVVRSAMLTIFRDRPCHIGVCFLVESSAAEQESKHITSYC